MNAMVCASSPLLVPLSIPRDDLVVIGFAVGGVEKDLARFLVKVGVAAIFSLFMTAGTQNE